MGAHGGALRKGFVVLDLTRSGLGGFGFGALPARPMVTRALTFEGAEAYARLAEAIQSTPETAIVRLSVSGPIPALLTAATIRSLAGSRHVMVRAVERLCLMRDHRGMRGTRGT